jgi:hypothetical protein
VDESGTIAAIGVSGFTLALQNGTQQQVTVSPTTMVGGMAHQFSDLKVHMRVAVQGILQADKSVAATHIAAIGL